MPRPTTRRARPQTARKANAVDAACDILDSATSTMSGLTSSRPELRPSLRDEDPRARAAKRAASLREHGVGDNDTVDDFAVNTAMIPDGWDYEWKRQTVLGAEDPAYQVQVAQGGWEPVPASRHPEFMPKGWKGEAIERKGMMLMERPREISDEARAREARKARLQVRTKEEQLTTPGSLEFDRKKADGSSLVSIKKSYEPMPIPE